MHSNQILVVVIVVIVVILLLMLVGWGWWSDQSGTKVNDETYRNLLILRHRLDDHAVFTREYSLELSENSAGVPATARQLDAINIAIARHLFSGCEDSKATELAALWSAKQLLLKRAQDGESDITLIPEIERNNAAILALMSCRSDGKNTVKLQEILNSHSLHTHQQLKDFAAGDYEKSFLTYALIKKDTQDLYDWLYAAIIHNKKSH